MNNKVIIAVLAVLVVCAVLVTAYLVLVDNKDASEVSFTEDEVSFTEEELSVYGITLQKEEMRIVLHDVATLDGIPFDSSDIPKKYVMLTFWASWCPDCIEENPSLQRLYEDRESETFSIVTISIDTNQAMLEAYLEANEFDFPVLINDKNNLWQEYFPVIPTSFLLNPDGLVTARIADSTDWDSKEARQMLDYLISLS